MSYSSNPTGAYHAYHEVGAGAPNTITTVPGGYTPDSGPSSGVGNSGADYSTDGGYSSSASNGNSNGNGHSNGNGYVHEFTPPRTYQHEQLAHHNQHGLVPAVINSNNPYQPHPKQYQPTPQQATPVPNPAYDHPHEMYAAPIPQQQLSMQSSSQTVPPVPQVIHPAPPAQVQAQRTTPVVPALPQGAPTNRQQQAQQQQYQRIARFVGPPPVALACTECRARHLKCDAGVPTCNRCQTDQRDCSYVKSRRGWKGTRRKKAVAAVAAREGSDEAKSGTETGSTLKEDATTAGPPPTHLTASPSSGQCTSFSKSPLPLANTPTRSSASSSTTKSPLDTLRTYHKNSSHFPSPQELPVQAPATANILQLYYAYFHSAHPFILPPAQFIKTPASQLSVLLPVIRYIASFFAQSADTEQTRRDAETVLFRNKPPRNAFTVQALLLFSIGLHSDNDQEKCAEVKDAAIELAVDLGMNTREFSDSSLDGTQDGRVLAESLRRTWWELYFTDGLLAGFHQRDSFKLWSMPCTVPLPCEERQYSTGCIPQSKSLQEFDDRYFARADTVFSSFAYRVDSVRILGQVLAVGLGDDPEDPRADAADASLVNWGLHLPNCKKDLVGDDRRVDEMLFQAHMVICAATVYLHRPKSHLAISTVPDDTSCTPQARWAVATKPRAQHTAKALTAANTISKLITLPTPLIKHTPFFTCVITLAAIVHLSACSWLLTGDEGFLAKERIRLGVGALKTLGEVWSVADCVLMQVKGVAREVFSLQAPVGTTRSGIISEEEVFRFIDEERTLEIVGGEADYHGLPELDWNGEWGVMGFGI